MSNLVYNFTPTIPTTATVAAPMSVPMQFPDAIVDTIEVRVPPGPNGVVGFALGSRGVQVIPYNFGPYIQTDNEVISWSVTGQFMSGDWSLLGWNVGFYSHTLHVRFLVSSIVPANPLLTTAVVPSSALSDPGSP